MRRPLQFLLAVSIANSADGVSHVHRPSQRRFLRFVVWFAALAAAPAVSQEARFTPLFFPHDVGSNLTCLAAGDLDGDGRPDLVVGSSLDNGYGIGLRALFANADGTFGRLVQFEQSSNLPTHGVAIADVDVDGRPDLVFTYASRFVDHTVTVLLGNGNGTFAEGIASSGITGSLAVGDFNLDGLPDLAGRQAVLLGRGDGGFGPPLAYPAGTNVLGVAAGDVDGDGRLDIVLADAGESYALAGVATVLAGHGDGTFSVRGSFTVGKAPSDVALGDLDGDGRVDAVVANYASNSISVLLGKGDGSFVPQPAPAVRKFPQRVLLADVVGDASRDIVLMHGCTPGITLLRGLGDGTFAAANEIGTGSGDGACAAADFDGDGRRDLAAAHSGCRLGGLSDGGGVSILLRDSEGGLGVPRYACGRGPAVVLLHDLDGDHRLDLAVANENSRSIAVLPGGEAGSFGPVTSLSLSGPVVALAAGDVNGDRLPDLLFAMRLPSSVGVLINQGGASFSPPSQLAADIDSRSIVTADLDGDGALDFVASDPVASSISVFYGNGAGGFPTRMKLSTGSGPLGMAVGDLDGDRKLDLIVACSASGSVSVFLGREGRAFGPRSDVATGQQPVAVAIGHVDRDPHADFAVSHRGSGRVRIFRGRGDGTFEPGTDLPAGLEPSDVLLRDLDRDHRDDVAVADAGRYEVAVFLGEGDGTFAPAQRFGTGLGPRSLAAGDVNHDNLPDLVVANGGSNDVVVLLNRSRSLLRPVLDVDPSSCGNVLARLSLRQLRVALLGGPGFDVSSVDAGSLLLEDRVTPLRSEVADVGTSQPGADPAPCGEAGPDGTPDLLLTFDAGQVARVLEPLFPGGEREVVLSGLLRDGSPFAARDRIVAASSPRAVAVAGPWIPNPVVARTGIHYALRDRVPIRLVVYDVVGRYVQEIEHGVRGPGRYVVAWDATAMPSGIYLVSLQAGESNAAAKVVIVH